MRKGTGRRGRGRREYYNPATNPKPRAIAGGEALDAAVAKETRQLRRKRLREFKENK